MKFKTLNKDGIQWRLNEDGMLRCTAAVMRSGILEFSAWELIENGVELPDYLEDRKQGNIRMYVSPEVLTAPATLKSLEGIPVSVYDHVWQVAGSVEAVGNTAGTPRYDPDSKLVFMDLIIEDPATIQNITEDAQTSSRLIEISAGYRNNTKWESGTTADGESYDAIQTDIDYNHVTLLPINYGRAGENVRIYNKQREVAQVEKFTIIKIGNSSIRVMNEDVDKLEKEMLEKDRKSENMIDASKLDDLMKQVEEAKQERDAANSKYDEAAGQLQQLKEQLEDALDPDNQASMVEEAVQDQEDADEILNEYGIEKTENMKKMFGHNLRREVVKAVRTLNKRTPFTEDQEKNEGFIKGCFSQMKENVNSLKTVNGAAMMKSLNSDSTAVMSKADIFKISYYKAPSAGDK